MFETQGTSQATHSTLFVRDLLIIKVFWPRTGREEEWKEGKGNAGGLVRVRAITSGTEKYQGRYDTVLQIKVPAGLDPTGEVLGLLGKAKGDGQRKRFHPWVWRCPSCVRGVCTAPVPELREKG